MKEKWNYFKSEIPYFLEQCGLSLLLTMLLIISFTLRMIERQKHKENLTNIIERYEKESVEYGK